MPRTAEDVESFLSELGRPFEADQGTYLVSTGTDSPPVALRVAESILAFRLDVGPVPADRDAKLALFERLLQLNATDLLFTSYGVEDGTMVLTAALELENLDKNELEAVLSDFDLAWTRQIPELSAIARGAHRR